MKRVTMPLSEIPVNQDRGWSIDSFGSLEEGVVFPASGIGYPRRQPHNAPSEARAQSDDGFARFLKQHSSPTHQRVTAGGRIVPMEPARAPPQFNLLIDNLARSKTSTSPKKMGAEPEFSVKRTAQVINSNSKANVKLPSVSRQNPSNSGSFHDHPTGPTQKAQVNTSAGDDENGNRMPRRLDVTHVTPAWSADIPQAFDHFSPSFNFTTFSPVHNQFGSLALPLSNTVFSPYANMLLPTGEQQPAMPTHTNHNSTFSSVSAADQTNFPITHGAAIDLAGQPDVWPKWNLLVPPISTGFNQPMNHALTGVVAPQGNLTQQIGTQVSAGYLPQTPALPQMPALESQFNSMTMNHSFDQRANSTMSNNTVSKVTQAEIGRADLDYRDLDKKLRGHDQYTATYHSTLHPQIKSQYAKERMKLVEQRDMARRKWMQLSATFDRERSAQQNQLTQAKHYPAPSTNAMNTPFQKNGNANFNVKAAAWVPKNMNQITGGQMQPYSTTAPNFSKATTFNKPANHAFSSGSQFPSFAARVNPQMTNPLTANPNMQLVVSSTSNAAPGPYTRQLYGENDGVLSSLEVDEWGCRRGCAPPQVAQKQSEEEMKLLAQRRNGTDAQVEIAPADRRVEQHLDSDSERPVDGWNVHIGQSPAELAQQQNEQEIKLKKMLPELRSQISLAKLDKLTSADNNTSKAVSMIIENAPSPTEIDWEAILVAGNQEKGVKTDVNLTNGMSFTVEAKGNSGSPISTAMNGQKSHRIHVLSEQDRQGITKQLMSIDKRALALDEAPKKRGRTNTNPWGDMNENDFFRNKGPSSVAIQSVTARGTMPGADGAIERSGKKVLKPAPNMDYKINRNVAKFGSPPKRSLKDIWGAPVSYSQALVKTTFEEQDMSNVKKTAYKY